MNTIMCCNQQHVLYGYFHDCIKIVLQATLTVGVLRCRGPVWLCLWYRVLHGVSSTAQKLLATMQLGFLSPGVPDEDEACCNGDHYDDEQYPETVVDGSVDDRVVVDFYSCCNKSRTDVRRCADVVQASRQQIQWRHQGARGADPPG